MFFQKIYFHDVNFKKKYLILCAKGNKSGSWNITGLFVSFAVLTREILFQHEVNTGREISYLRAAM